jgi:hypothetical protein
VYPVASPNTKSDAVVNACFAATWPVTSKTAASHCRGDTDRAMVGAPNVMASTNRVHSINYWMFGFFNLVLLQE